MRSVAMTVQDPARDAARTAQQNLTRQEVRQLVDKIKQDVQQEVQAAKAARLDAQAAAKGASEAAVAAEQGLPVPPTPPSPPPTPDWYTETAAQWTPDAVGNQVKQVMGLGGIILFSLLVGVPLARAFARWMDRRGAVVPVPREVTSRLEAIEQAVESIAVEVERISEGQRFTTRLLSERTHEPVPDFAHGAREREAVAVAASGASSPLR